MLRVNLVEELLYSFCNKMTKDTIAKDDYLGLSALEVSEKLNILRNNASADLNRLHREGKLIKIKGKPTRYFSKAVVEALFKIKLDGLVECDSINSLLKAPSKEQKDDPFSNVIGIKDSLYPIVQMAKASILYPPNGLHTILLGESGVGKSFFAEIMYKYGVKEKVFKPDSEFVVFNCADYASNTNLLLSQLFGSAKGAYTGAGADRIGLVERANGGVLFLDEVHRLPPEGQEMLFFLMDKKMYRRLGEMNIERTADVLIIAATTENPRSNLLVTFMRRIPIVINIPSLRERSLLEKLEIVNTFYSIESHKINKSIVLSKNVMAHLITYSPDGNIGQLRSDIQLSVARAYLETTVTKNNIVKIDVGYLPQYITNGILNLDVQMRKQLEILLPKDEYIFQPDSKVLVDDNKTSYDFINYFNEKLLDKKYSTLDIQNIFEEYTAIISKNIALSSNYPNFINDEIKEIVSATSDILFKELTLSIDKSAYIALALYFKNLKENNSENTGSCKYTKYSNTSGNVYKTAQKFIKLLERDFGIYCSPGEVTTLSIILDSLKNKTKAAEVDIMVVAHGVSLASNIADVVNELLSTSHVVAMDMPLSQSLQVTMDLMVEKIKLLNKSNDMIVFVDMGSLTSIDKFLSEKTGLNIATVDSNNIILILEATRKAIFLKEDMIDILSDLIQLNSRISNAFNKKIEKYLAINRKKIIYAVCMSGEGTAFYIEQSIRQLLNKYSIYDIEVVPLSVKNEAQIKNVIGKLSMDKEVLAVIGTVNPEFDDCAFISLEEILLNNGINIILRLIGIEARTGGDIKIIENINRDLIINISCEAINKYLLYLSAEKIAWALLSFMEDIEKSLDITLTNKSIIKLFIHMACMIERILFQQQVLTADEEIKVYSLENVKLLKTIRKCIKQLEEKFIVKIDDNEFYYLAEIIKGNIE